jgi:alkyl sulfatase BDS1-like metallo-beta-lactamase superfamily hydrolase
MPDAHWLETLLYAAGGLVATLYMLQVLWPKIRGLFPSGPSPEERTAALMQNYNASQKSQQWSSFGFDGNATNLSPLSARERARRFAGLVGGAEKLRRAAEQALAEGDARWAAELTDHLLTLDEHDAAAKHLKADALTALAEQQMNPDSRKYYLAQARQLRGAKPAPGA